MKNRKLLFILSLIIIVIPFFLFIIIPQLDTKKRIAAQWNRSGKIPGGLEMTYPQTGALFPPEIVAPTVTWQDKNTGIKNWYIHVTSGSDNELASAFTEQQSWKPGPTLWETIKQHGLKQPVIVNVLGFDKGKIQSGSSTIIRTSPDSVNAAIFYRAIPLPFSYALTHLEEIRWHLGDISSTEPPQTMLENLPLCGNCHTFTRDGGTLAMDADYANDKGSYVISEITKETVLTIDKIITWSDYKPEDGRKTFGLLSQISPDGRYAASTVKDRSIFVPIDNIYYSQLFFPIKGIIGIYDRETEKFSALPGADDPVLVQSNPSWSPDGEYIYFARTKAYYHTEAEKSKDIVLPTAMAKEFIDGEKEFKYDIYRIPFNGGRGGKPEPVLGASKNGKSNFFPRISPDGKWLVYTQADNFMLLQPDSRLYIIPADGGAPRELNCNTSKMNSWHSWSPNGKWLLFASKLRGPYAEILLTHIDEDGNDSPPVLLDYLSYKDRSINIPEFVNLKAQNWQKIVDRFTNQSFYYFTIGRNRMGEKKYAEAITNFDKAIGMDPTYAEVYVFKGHTEFITEQYRKAVQTYNKAIELKTTDPDVYINKGTALYKLKDYKGAIEAYNIAIKKQPDNAYAYYTRGSSKAKLDDIKGAISDFDKALGLDPNSDKALYERGLCKALLKDYEGAVMDLLQVTRIDPKNYLAFAKIGDCCYELKKYKGATEAYDRALKINPNEKMLYMYRAASKSALQDHYGAMNDYDRAITLDTGYAAAYFNKGLVEIKIGQKEQGCADLLRAKKLGYKGGEREIQKYCSQ